MDNGRRFVRVDFEVEALIKQGEASVKGRVKNLSLHGIFVETAEEIVLDTPLQVTIYLTGTSPLISINAAGVAVRVEEGGIAIRFEKLDVESFTHLRSIVSYQYGDGDKVMGEFFNYLDERHRGD